jgi:hypothetical protein
VWSRNEFQDRGALHFHGVYWIQEIDLKNIQLSAELPRGRSKTSFKARQLILKVNMHL